MAAEVYCTNCGHRNHEGANFCSSCGQPVEHPSEDPATITFAIDSSPSSEDLEIKLEDVGPGGALVVTRGPNTGSEFALEQIITTVGRHPDSDIFLDDVTVSRRHVEIERASQGYLVRDVGSLNGTYLNHERIDADAPMVNGDELQVGRFKLVFVAGEG